MYVRPISTRLLRGTLTPAIRAISESPLALLVAGVLADDEHRAVTADDLALLAHRLDRRSYLHDPFRRCLARWHGSGCRGGCRCRGHRARARRGTRARGQVTIANGRRRSFAAEAGASPLCERCLGGRWRSVGSLAVCRRGSRAATEREGAVPRTTGS